MLKEFKGMGYDTGIAETPIIPLMTGDMDTTFKLAIALDEAGIFINPVIPPAVPSDRCLIRTSYMATHTDDQMDYVLDVFRKIGKELGLID